MASQILPKLPRLSYCKPVLFSSNSSVTRKITGELPGSYRVNTIITQKEIIFGIPVTGKVKLRLLVCSYIVVQNILHQDKYYPRCIRCERS